MSYILNISSFYLSVVRRQSRAGLKNEQWQLMDTGEVELDGSAAGRRDLGLGVPEKCIVSGPRTDSDHMASFETQEAKDGEETQVEATVF